MGSLGDETMLYICDPQKNVQCTKDNCFRLCGGNCYKTTDRACAIEHYDGSPMESGTVDHWHRRPWATARQLTYNNKEGHA